MNLDTLTDEQIATLVREGQRVQTQLARAKSIGLVATLTIREWIEIVDRYQGLCAFCKDRPFDAMEHLMPIQSGGGTTAGNCVPVCTSCNSRKGMQTAYAEETGVFTITKGLRKKTFDYDRELAELSYQTQQYVSLEDAAKHLKVSYKTIWRMVNSKKLYAIRAGGQWRIPKEELEKSIENGSEISGYSA
jgi:excisionase family DNA binding protein